MQKIFFRIGVIILSFCISTLVRADEAPVVDITQSNSSPEQMSSSSQAVTSPVAVDPPMANNSDQPIINNAVPDQAPQMAQPTNLSASSQSVGQRVARLESQMDNLVQMNLPQQVSALQESLQKLQGELQVAQHDLKVLSDQQHSFYQDLDQRLAQIKKGSVEPTIKTPNISSSTSDNEDAAPPADPSNSLKDAEAYHKAFQLFSKKDYESAKPALQNYIKNYPRGKFMANSHYWLGEIYLSQKNITFAAKEFNIVTQNFPKSPRVADAKLKIATIHINQQKVALARKELAQIKKQYPDSTAAQLASIQLQQLEIGTQD